MHPCSENKGADQLRGYLICAFVFAYADCWFSHAVANIEYKEKHQTKPTTVRFAYIEDGDLYGKGLCKRSACLLYSPLRLFFFFFFFFFLLWYIYSSHTMVKYMFIRLGNG